MKTNKEILEEIATARNYAKHTRKFNNPYTAKFRDILADAKDPAKAFFEDIPAAFGYNSLEDESFVEQYVDLIRSAVHELNACYDSFIDRIENCVKEHIGVDPDMDFENYKSLIDKKYSSVNKALLTQKTKSFVERLLSPSSSKKEFFEKTTAQSWQRPRRSLAWFTWAPT